MFIDQIPGSSNGTYGNTTSNGDNLSHGDANANLIIALIVGGSAGLGFLVFAYFAICKRPQSLKCLRTRFRGKYFVYISFVNILHLQSGIQANTIIGLHQFQVCNHKLFFVSS